MNGQLLVDQGAALMQAQDNLTAASLAEQISLVCGDPERCLQMAKNARKLAKAGAAERVAHVCLEVANA